MIISILYIYTLCSCAQFGQAPPQEAIEKNRAFKFMENSRWVRGKLIGKGSFGAVSLGFDRTDGRVFAVKSVAINSASDSQTEAIENEIRILRSLSSPFIVNYYDDDTTVSPALVYRNLHMEYLSGGTLSELSTVGVDEDLIQRYTWCLTSALKYIHSRGIIHCDVKGKNVLLGSTLGTAKLADFGSAMKEGDDRRVRIVPRGSPLWMAPEVVRGECQGYESDVWALGCTVIEMVTGAPAWRDEGAETLRLIGYSDELPQLPTRLSDLGKDFLQKCLKRDPAQRWSCDQLLHHPFLQLKSTVEIEESPSPRSVIEWPRLRVSSDDEEDTEEEDSKKEIVEERIGNLAGIRGAIWESDGWVTVRGILAEESNVSYGCNEEPGMSSENCESVGAELEFQTSVGCSDVSHSGFGGAELAAMEESEMFIFAPEICGELLYIILLILHYTSYLSYHSDTRNVLYCLLYFFTCFYDTTFLKRYGKLN